MNLGKIIWEALPSDLRTIDVKSWFYAIRNSMKAVSKEWDALKVSNEFFVTYKAFNRTMLTFVQYKYHPAIIIFENPSIKVNVQNNTGTDDPDYYPTNADTSGVTHYLPTSEQVEIYPPILVLKQGATITETQEAQLKKDLENMRPAGKRVEVRNYYVE